MANSEWMVTSDKKIFEEFPELEGWFADPENTTAQVAQGKRLLSASERIAILGGVEKIKETIAREYYTPESTSIVLLACSYEPMTGFELGIFETLMGLKPQGKAVSNIVSQLYDKDLIRATGGLTYIVRTTDPKLFCYTTNKLGFLTADYLWPEDEKSAKHYVEERDAQAEEVASLVGHINVQEGRWVSLYQVFSWKLMKNLPQKFSPAVRMAERILHPRFDWEAEAFRIDADAPYYTSLHLAMRSHGGAPLNVPLFGKPHLKLKEVISPALLKSLSQLPLLLPYREYLKLTLPVIFSAKPDGIEPNRTPAYNEVIIKPFWLFAGEGDKERVVAEDPFRLVFQITGAPVGYMKEEIQREGESLGIEDLAKKIIFFEG